MKICANCKKVGDDSSSFCQYCGSGSFEQPNPQQDFSQQNFNPQQAAESFNPAVSAVKSLGSSALFSAAVILFTVFAAFGLINYLANVFGSNFEGLNALPYGNIRLNVGNLAEATRNYSIASVILHGIPNVLICIGLWRFQRFCRRADSSGFSSTAFRVLRVTLIIRFITAIAFQIAYGVYVSKIVENIEFTDNTIFNSPYFEQPNHIDINKTVTSTTISIIIFAIGIAIIIGSIYYAKILKTFASISNTFSTGVASDYISMFVVVMNYIYAFLALSALSESTWSFLANGCYIAFLIIMSILLVKYRNEMRMVIYRHQYDFANRNNPYGFNAGLQ